MSKFEQIGIEHQLESSNKYEALKSFKHSCYVCCYKGIHINCDRCGIAETHKELIAYFEDIENKKECCKCVQ